MNKRGIYFLIISLIFIFILLTNIVSSACTGGVNQLIMRISSTTNAHGEIYSGTAYTQEICYDDIFVTPYDIINDPTPHTCETGNTNKILGLSANTNAHAQEPSLDTYDTDICYGNLGCNVVTSGDCDIANGYKCVITLSSSTNAHLAKCGIVGSSYDNKICCKPGAVTPPPENCGNDELNDGEDCDGTKFRITKCEDLDMGLTGSLGCTSTCLYDASACVQSCSGYTSDETCNEDFFSASEFDVGTKTGNNAFCDGGECGGGTGSVSVTCKCVWIDANGCVAEWTRTDSCSSENDGTCTYFGGDTIDNCDTTGKYSISWTATWDGNLPTDLQCVEGSRDFACPTIAELPFFTTISIITSLFLISAIYFIKIFSKKGKYSKKI